MEPGSNTTSRKPRKRAMNGAIPPHQNRKNSAHNHLRERLCFLLGWTRGDFAALHDQGEHCDQRYADLLKNHLRPAMKSKRRGRLSTGVLLQLNARPHTACPAVATIQDLSFECLPHPPYSPPVTFMSLDRSKRWWEAILSGPTKRWSRRSTTDCALSQNNFFSRDIHALPKRCNTCMERNGEYIEKLSHCVPFCSINYEITNILGLHSTLPRAVQSVLVDFFSKMYGWFDTQQDTMSEKNILLVATSSMHSTWHNNFDKIKV